MSPSSSEKNEKNNKINNLRNSNYKRDNDESHLQLCVPLTQPRMLNMEGSHSNKNRKQKNSFSPLKIIMVSISILFVMYQVHPFYLPNIF
jgi:hypothetical protein